MAGRDSTIGTKLGPRLAQLMAQATISTKQGLADTEHRLRVASTRTIVDWAGVEFAQIMGPLIDPVLRQKTLPPHIQRVMENITSGQNQWQAFAGVAFNMSGAPGMIGTIMNNYLAPGVYEAVRAQPNLVPDIGTLAGLAAHNAIDLNSARHTAGGLGYATDWFDSMLVAAYTQPDLGSLIELNRRKIVDDGVVYETLRRAGFEEQYARSLVALSSVPLSVADAALALLRGHMDTAEAQQVADLNGVSHHDLQVLVDNTGEPPALDALLGLWRRGKLDDAGLEKGIRQSRVRDEWIPTIKQLGIIPPSPADALDAYLKGQVSESEAKSRYIQAGGDPTWFTNAYNANGEAPTPVQAGDMANRGIIPWTGTGPDSISFEQAFLEGPWRNKWLEPYRKSVEYLPPPRTVTALLNEGAITIAEAQDLLQRQGLSADLAKAYTLESSHTKTKKQRDLTVGQIETLYRDQAIDNTTASTMLVSLGFDATEAAFILTTVDFARISQALSEAIGAVHTAYTNHRIDRATASGQLDGLNVPSGQRDQLLTVWDNERATRVKVLTEAQIHSAVKKDLMSLDDAINRLVQMGYSADDAAILLAL